MQIDRRLSRPRYPDDGDGGCDPVIQPSFCHANQTRFRGKIDFYCVSAPSIVGYRRQGNAEGENC
jgi:hypothetical protein